MYYKIIVKPSEDGHVREKTDTTVKRGQEGVQVWYKGSGKELQMCLEEKKNGLGKM